MCNVLFKCIDISLVQVDILFTDQQRAMTARHHILKLNLQMS